MLLKFLKFKWVIANKVIDKDIRRKELLIHTINSHHKMLLEEILHQQNHRPLIYITGQLYALIITKKIFYVSLDSNHLKGN